MPDVPVVSPRRIDLPTPLAERTPADLPNISPPERFMRDLAGQAVAALAWKGIETVADGLALGAGEMVKLARQGVTLLQAAKSFHSGAGADLKVPVFYDASTGFSLGVRVTVDQDPARQRFPVGGYTGFDPFDAATPGRPQLEAVPKSVDAQQIDAVVVRTPRAAVRDTTGSQHVGAEALARFVETRSSRKPAMIIYFDPEIQTGLVIQADHAGLLFDLRPEPRFWTAPGEPIEPAKVPLRQLEGLNRTLVEITDRFDLPEPLLVCAAVGVEAALPSLLEAQRLLGVEGAAKLAKLGAPGVAMLLSAVKRLMRQGHSSRRAVQTAIAWSIANDLPHAIELRAHLASLLSAPATRQRLLADVAHDETLTEEVVEQLEYFARQPQTALGIWFRQATSS